MQRHNSRSIQQTKYAESLEEKFASRGLSSGAITYNPKTDKIYLGDARNEDFDDSRWLINLEKWRQAKVLGASGKIADVDGMKGVFSNLYYQMVANKKRLVELHEKSNRPIAVIGKSILGAAGPTATTDYNAIRQTGTLLDAVIGQEHANENYQAINIADKVSKNAVKFEYIKRTSAVIEAQKNIADEDEASPLKHVYTTGTKEIFAYGLSMMVSMRDTIDTKADIIADFKSQVPGAFLAAKNSDVITLLNAITGNNQGDWDAFTGGIPDVNAAAQVQTAEDAVKAYGRPLVAVFASNSLRAYFQNLQGAYQARIETNLAGRSTSTAPAKTGELPGNPGITYYVDDLLTAGSYVLAAKQAYLKHFQAMTIQTSYKNPKNPGQTEQMFWYEFAGFEETQIGAQYKGTTVTA